MKLHSFVYRLFRAFYRLGRQIARGLYALGDAIFFEGRFEREFTIAGIAFLVLTFGWITWEGARALPLSPAFVSSPQVMR